MLLFANSAPMMLQFKWLLFQGVVTMITFILLGQITDITKYGMAPAAISMGVAFVASWLVARFLNWRDTRRFRISDQPERKEPSFFRAGSRSSDLPEQIAGPRVRQDVRKLP